MTAVFLTLLCWLVFETQGGSYLGMAERLTSSVQTSWPFVVALVLWRQAARTRPPGLPGEPPGTFHARALTADGRAMEPTTTEELMTEALRGQRDLT